MSDQSGLNSKLTEEAAPLPAGPTAELQTAGSKKPHESDSIEDRKTSKDEELKEEEKEKEDQEKEEEREDQDGEEEEEEEEEEEKVSGPLQEPSTLPWPGDKDKRPQMDNEDEVHSEKAVLEPEERDAGISGGSQELSEEQSQTESDRKGKAKWRESMPEGERWRDDESEVQLNNKGDGSLADDEEEEEEEEDEQEESHWISEKPALGFTPQVRIVRPSSKELPEESRVFIERDMEKEPQVEPESEMQMYANWNEEDDKYYLCEHVCSENARLALGLVAAGLLFPLLVWLGYTFLPFDSPVLVSTPLRVVYTLRCSFFAIIPILLGVVVQGAARLRYSALKPLYQSPLVNREVAVHWHFVHESLALFLFYFLQLAVMATYISQDLVKLVPLLTIIFVFGRLIYWLCLALDSSIRGFGFGFSFFPILVMLGINLYYVCASVGHEAVFDVGPSATAPPPRLRWWN